MIELIELPKHPENGETLETFDNHLGDAISFFLGWLLSDYIMCRSDEPFAEWLRYGKMIRNVSFILLLANGIREVGREYEATGPLYLHNPGILGQLIAVALTGLLFVNSYFYDTRRVLIK